MSKLPKKLILKNIEEYQKQKKIQEDTTWLQGMFDYYVMPNLVVAKNGCIVFQGLKFFKDLYEDDHICIYKNEGFLRTIHYVDLLGEIKSILK